MQVCRTVTSNIKFAGIHLYTRLKRGTVRVKFLAQERNTMSPAEVRSRTVRAGDERTMHETTVPPGHRRQVSCKVVEISERIL